MCMCVLVCVISQSRLLTVTLTGLPSVRVCD